MVKGAQLMAKTSFSYSYRRADVIICISETTKNIFKKYYPQYADKCKVIPHHDIFFYDNEQPNQKKSKGFSDLDLRKNLPEDFILSVGNTKPYKNIKQIQLFFSLVCRKKRTTFF